MPGPSSDQEGIGERLRRLRSERGLSQRDLAEKGISNAYISRIEAGVRRPSVGALRKLAAKLGVSAEYLETGRDLGPREDREIRLAQAELDLRLAENPGAAEEALRGLVREAESAGDGRSAVRARTALGLSALQRGDYGAAIAELEFVVSNGNVTPVVQPEVFGFLGRAYAASGRFDEAVGLLESCLRDVESEAPDDDSTYVRFALYLAYALSDIGELGRARDVLGAAIERATTLADPYMAVRLYWSQARLSAEEGDPRAALAMLRRATALLEATEDRRQLGRAHLLWAEILTLDGRSKEAGPHLQIAEQQLGANPDVEDLRWLRVEQARYAAERGLHDEAISRAREAIAASGADEAERGAAYWALAKGLAVKGDRPAADDAFRQAVDLLESQNSWRRAVEVCRDWATSLREAGRESEAVIALDRATELALRGTRSLAGDRRRQ